MRNRQVQRQMKKLLSSGVPAGRIRIIHEEELNKTCEWPTKQGRPIPDLTPWEAIKPGTRIVVNK